MALSSTAFACEQPNSEQISNKNAISINKDIPTPYALLFEETKVSDSDGHYISTEFATPNSNKINVYFKNTGTATVKVTFEKKGVLGSWSSVGSFSVSAGSEDFSSFTGDKATYRVKLDCSSGARITGHVRANQL